MPTISKESRSKKFMNISVGLAALFFIIFVVATIIFMFMLPSILTETASSIPDESDYLGYIIINKLIYKN